MPTRKCPYSLKQHRELGAALKTMRDELLKISTGLGEAYTKKLALLASRSSEQIDRLRCELDNIVCREHTDHDDSIVQVYYPGSKTGKP